MQPVPKNSRECSCDPQWRERMSLVVHPYSGGAHCLLCAPGWETSDLSKAFNSEACHTHFWITATAPWPSARDVHVFDPQGKLLGKVLCVDMTAGLAYCVTEYDHSDTKPWNRCAAVPFGSIHFGDSAWSLSKKEN
jgi:hypothetical protein